MSTREFRVTDVNYQRNGIAGRPFHAIRFSVEIDGVFRPNMFATVPFQPKMDNGDHEFYVVDLNAPAESLRGDSFRDDLVAAIAKHEEDEDRGVKERIDAARENLLTRRQLRPTRQ